jgi:hypothetical protein
MLAVVSLFVIVFISLLITRIGSVALNLTGVSKDLAYFQAFSAFSGVGFTTRESEQVVNHPVRRRILMALMLAGNLGVVTAVSSLILTFVQVESGIEWLTRILLLLFGLIILLILGSSKWVNQFLYKIITWGLRRWTHLDVYDYDKLLQLSDGYSVLEIKVSENDWLADKSLAVLDLIHEGALILGIRRPNASYIGSPKGSSIVHAGDTLILYGRQSLLTELSNRKKGAEGGQAHKQALDKQRHLLEEQAQLDAQNES